MYKHRSFTLSVVKEKKKKKTTVGESPVEITGLSHLLVHTVSLGQVQSPVQE